MLRTCNTVRIAGLPVLRNDGAGLRPCPRTRRGTGKGGFETRPYVPTRPTQPTSKPSSLISDIC
ncbi:MAG: hypothetical protein LBM98_11045 [Oscillospiraceae bacterium]|nr:hypothetical protein [Oscillospiraceae bacterium]